MKKDKTKYKDFIHLKKLNQYLSETFSALSKE